MDKMKKLVAAVVVAAAGSISGCASTQVAELARLDSAPAPAVEAQVIRPMQSYGAMGGYRYRRFASVAAAS